MEYAIVENGGKQYRAVPGATIDIDHMPVEIGDQVEFDRVLLHSDGKKVSVGTPTIEGALVQAKAVAQIKAPKIVVFKYKPSKRYRVKSGHRQRYTRLLIEKIQAK